MRGCPFPPASKMEASTLTRCSVLSLIFYESLTINADPNPNPNPHKQIISAAVSVATAFEAVARDAEATDLLGLDPTLTRLGERSARVAFLRVLWLKARFKPAAQPCIAAGYILFRAPRVCSSLQAGALPHRSWSVVAACVCYSLAFLIRRSIRLHHRRLTTSNSISCCVPCLSFASPSGRAKCCPCEGRFF